MQNGQPKKYLTTVILLLMASFAIYLCVAWASYTPLDNSWSSANSATQEALNRAGSLGAWVIDLLFAMFGRVTFVIPLALLSVSFYLLIMRRTLAMATSLGWLVSFILLMFGLASLATLLLSNSVAYLSGGVVGSVLVEYGQKQIGQIATLSAAILFTLVGLYFCSVQTLFKLLGQLYDWIIGHPTSHQDVPLQAVSSAQQFANAETTEELASESTTASADVSTQAAEVKLTDVSVFTRPKITGLKSEQHPTLDLDDSTMNVAEHTVRLNPTVDISVAEENAFLQPKANIEHNERHGDALFSPTTALPKIRLDSPDENLQIVEQNSPLVEETASVDEPAQPSELNAHPDFVKPKASVVLPDPVESTVPTANAYTPVVHPLLQRKIATEKPTTPFPTLDLLTTKSQTTSQLTNQQIWATSDRIEQELANFGVKAKVEDVLVGPVVTRYEIKPAAGVKASKITSLESDLARSLVFDAIRITDVVPGKPFMGIETPNPQRETVWLRDVLDSDAFRHTKAILPMALGKDISGKSVVVDMAQMPHLLVAGQTGGGKSVGINTMILSLLFKLSPEDVRFIMIDPKVVELSIYNDIPHLLTPVVTDVKKAENALRWAVEEMERRYLLVNYLLVRSIEGYNNKIAQAEAMNLPIKNPYWKPSDSMDLEAPALKKMSYIVLIVDEFADLMMSVGKQVEDHIMRIAQKARAVGIHLILATQRPSTDVITGVIKANIPSRIAFTVASQIDSRTILDKGGAESLLGRGDMLYSGSSNPDIIRIHGAFMTDEDVQRVVDNWRARGKPDYIESIVESAEENDSEGKGKSQGNGVDPLFDEVAQYMIEGGLTSISGVQRYFSLGFNRAARIVEQLEEQGILSAPDNRGKREVLARKQ